MSRLSEAPQAAAFDTPPVPAPLHSVPAKDAGGHANHFRRLPLLDLAPVKGVEQVNGYSLMTDAPERTAYGAAEFYARGPEGDRHIDVSPWLGNFRPTQARFSWFVRNGFPPRPGVVAWTNPAIDAAIAAEWDRDDIETLISDAISDSLDQDWQPSWGARAVLDALLANGIVFMPQPSAQVIQ